MIDKDRQFFEFHWEEWVKRNPPPDNWRGTEKQWAFTEMPCWGILGKFLFWFDLWLSRKKSS